jgi:hypothetical protein
MRFVTTRERHPFRRFDPSIILPPAMLQEQFQRARSADYSLLLEELQKFKPSATCSTGQITRFRRRCDEIVALDGFECPLRRKVEDALTQAEPPGTKAKTAKKGKASKADEQNRTWSTRPRPGIDRVSSAWLNSRFMDAKASFIFGGGPSADAPAVPRDRYQGDGFRHAGDRCTFEGLWSSFAIGDKKVRLRAQPKKSLMMNCFGGASTVIDGLYHALQESQYAEDTR